MQSIAAQSYMTILVTGVNPQKVLSLQLIEAHSYMAMLGRRVFRQKYSHCSPALCFMVIFVRGYFLRSCPVAAYCSPLLPDNFSQIGNSTKVLSFQPNASQKCMAILVRGLVPQKCSKKAHCSPHLHSSFRYGGYFLKKSPISAHCSPLLYGNFCQE